MIFTAWSPHTSLPSLELSIYCFTYRRNDVTVSKGASKMLLFHQKSTQSKIPRILRTDGTTRKLICLFNSTGREQTLKHQGSARRFIFQVQNRRAEQQVSQTSVRSVPRTWENNWTKSSIRSTPPFNLFYHRTHRWRHTFRLTNDQLISINYIYKHADSRPNQGQNFK